MQLENKYIFIIFYILFLATSYATNPPVLMTKGPVENVRFISKDGKYTYGQRYTGDLLLTRNYDIIEILKGTKGTHYQIVPFDKKIVILKDKTFFTHFSALKNKDLYVTTIGSDKVISLPQGLSPKLHINEQWISFYNAKRKVLRFIHLENKDLKFQVKIQKSKSPFFIPKVEMIDFNRILYTVENKEGRQSLIFLERSSKKQKAIYQAPSAITKIELCKDDNIYVGLFPLQKTTKFHSEILKLNGNSLSSPLYKNLSNDIGNMICNIEKDSIFFTQQQKERYNLVKLNAKTKELSSLNKLNFISQTINFSGNIIAPVLNKNYILYGKHDYTKDDLLILEDEK